MTAPPAGPRTAAADRPGALWRQPDFRNYALGQGISVAGSGVTLVAVPVVAALQLHASTMQVAGLAVAGRLPPLLFTLHAGVLADRWPKRPIVIGCELATVPLASLVAAPSLVQLYAVTFLVASLQVLGSTASTAFVPQLVEQHRLVEANARLGTGNSLADTAGSNMGGLLVGVLGAARAVAADSLSYLLSAVLLLRVRTPEPARTEPGQRTGMIADIRAGLAYTLRTPLVRAAVLSNTVNASAMAACAALWSLFLLRTLGWPPAVLGLVMGAGGIGGAIGGITGRRLAARFGPGRVIITALALSPLCQLPLLLAQPGTAGQVAIGAAMVVQTGCAVAGGALLRSIRQLIAPPEMQGRAQSSGMWLAFGLRPLAAFAAGVAGAAFGLRPTLTAITCLLAVPAWMLWRSPIRHLTSLPAPGAPGAARPALEPAAEPGAPAP
ncbi:MFS transporter [Streptacidiphilus jiangxiensis]|uniref:Predicted arabinose efflux permease, MFS family n=1 Tax=Streptacidiphilus jiangxiensis TaxID=235985 RepID=A0A1H8B2V7_STRJI|nr:MFS transporter [Streptacidiphilus jiangxiensis]SEM77103.1 Predicted arabinose efflux permease, MFS family [Streptacidiphilus jiangxiensis]